MGCTTWTQLSYQSKSLQDILLLSVEKFKLFGGTTDIWCRTRRKTIQSRLIHFRSLQFQRECISYLYGLMNSIFFETPTMWEANMEMQINLLITFKN
jgi:hypothetical protein